VISQVLTLYTTPVIYLYMERLARFIKRGKKGEPEGTRGPPEGLSAPAPGAG
jgi:hypothetical protein